MRILPILFNTDMVRAILDGRKTVTRRLIKAPVLSKVEPPKKVNLKNGVANFEWNTPKTAGGFEIKMPYQPGDIMYVRETWHKYKKRVGNGEGCHIAEFYGYKASIANSEDANEPWKPSIHMPKEAARIWLKVKDVRVERLQEMTVNGLQNEGVLQTGYISQYAICSEEIFSEFKELWNSTIKESDLDRYGWDASPWVWVIEFERCEKPADF